MPRLHRWPRSFVTAEEHTTRHLESGPLQYVGINREKLSYAIHNRPFRVGNSGWN